VALAVLPPATTVTVATPDLRNRRRTLRGAVGVTLTTVGSAAVNEYAVPGTKTLSASSALAVSWTVSPTAAENDVGLSETRVTRCATTIVALAFVRFTRAVTVVVPRLCAVTVPSSFTVATLGSDDVHSTPAGVWTALPSEVADSASTAVFEGKIVSDTRIVAASGDRESERAIGANGSVVESLEHPATMLAPSVDKANRRRTKRIHDLQ
jgi:hypothetical protein